jgi:hypothetical protein
VPVDRRRHARDHCQSTIVARVLVVRTVSPAGRVHGERCVEDAPAEERD